MKQHGSVIQYNVPGRINQYYLPCRKDAVILENFTSSWNRPGDLVGWFGCLAACQKTS